MQNDWNKIYDEKSLFYRKKLDRFAFATNIGVLTEWPSFLKRRSKHKIYYKTKFILPPKLGRFLFATIFAMLTHRSSFLLKML